MASIQFYGVQAVVKAAENREIPRWAIFCGKQFLNKYEGEDMPESVNLLSEFLTAIQHSEAVYTVKFYETAGKIKENTPCDGSFNFRLVDEETRAYRSATYSAASGKVLERLEAIEQRLSEKDEDEPEAMGSIGNIFLGLLKEPEKLGMLFKVGKELLFGSRPQPAQPVTINGIPDQGTEERIVAAIQTLQERDPKICEHLEKLAAISTSDPGTFKMLIGMLEKF